MIKRSQIIAAVLSDLSRTLDPLLKPQNFERTPRALSATRVVADCRQVITIDLASHPSYDRSALAHIKAHFDLVFSEVNAIAGAMLCDERWSAPKFPTVRTFVIDGSGEEANVYVKSLVELEAELAVLTKLIGKGVLPILAECTTVDSLIKMFEEQDPRLQWQENCGAILAAAHLTTGNSDAARRVLTTQYEKPGLRRRYSSCFEYVARH